MITREYTFYSDGFFGYGAEGDFVYGSAAHILPMVLLAVLVAVVWRRRTWLQSWKGEENLRFAMAALILLAEMSYFWRLIYVGSGKADEGTLMTKLPLQVCEWTAIAAAFMLMKKSRHLYAICYYVCLTFGLIPLVTPAVLGTTGPGYYRYYQFWMEHLLPILAVFYMTFVHGYRVRLRDAWKPSLFLIVLLVLAVPANFAIPEANYLYLAQNTDGSSIANIFPENIFIRASIYFVIMLVLFGLIYLPMHYVNRWKAAVK